MDRAGQFEDGAGIPTIEDNGNTITAIGYHSRSTGLARTGNTYAYNAPTETKLVSSSHFSSTVYGRVKPLLQTSLQLFRQRGDSTRDFVRYTLRRFGMRIHPYLQQFLTELTPATESAPIETPIQTPAPKQKQKPSQKLTRKQKRKLKRRQKLEQKKNKAQNGERDKSSGQAQKQEPDREQKKAPEPDPNREPEAAPEPESQQQEPIPASAATPEQHQALIAETAYLIAEENGFQGDSQVFWEQAVLLVEQRLVADDCEPATVVAPHRDQHDQAPDDPNR